MINEKTLDIDLRYTTFDNAILLVKKEINKTLTSSPLIIREYTSHLAKAQGKNIRALSVIMCAEDKEGKVDLNAVKVAAAIELVHLATLVHDDVIDNADIRRGISTIQKKYGKRTAVICGDYILCAAINLIATISNKKEYLDISIPDYMGKVCLGELNQHVNNHNLNLSYYQYLKIISGKTAALFEASFYGGSIFSGCKEDEINQFKRLGNYIGMIFQLTDDCIDFENTIDEAHKPVQSDYEQGVITLPLIYALMNKVGFKDKAINEGITREEINQAVYETDGLGFTKLIVKKYYVKSMNVINNLDINQNKKERLVTLLNKASRISL